MVRQDHLALVTSFDEKKKVISLMHYFNEAFRYNMHCLYPAIVPIAYCLMYVLRCGEYRRFSIIVTFLGTGTGTFPFFGTPDFFRSMKVKPRKKERNKKQRV